MKSLTSSLPPEPSSFENNMTVGSRIAKILLTDEKYISKSAHDYMTMRNHSNTNNIPKYRRMSNAL